MEKPKYRNYKKDRIDVYKLASLANRILESNNGVAWYYYLIPVGFVLIPWLVPLFYEDSSTLMVLFLIAVAYLGMGIYVKYRRTQILLYKLLLNSNDIYLGLLPNYLPYESDQLTEYSNGKKIDIQVPFDHWQISDISRARSYFLDSAKRYTDNRRVVDYFDSDELIDSLIKDNKEVYGIKNK